MITFQTLPEALTTKNSVIKVTVDPGPPVKIAGSTIVLEGDARLDPEYQAWIKKGRPETGTILNQGDYDSFKNGFSSLALRNGYFDGEFKKVNLACRSTGAKPSGIWTMTAANVTALAM